MLKAIQTVRTLNSTCASIRNFQHSSSSKTKWDLLTAVCLERKPIVTPALTEFESTFQKYLSEKEYELSYKSDHELQHESELKQQSLLKKGEIDLDVSTKQTAQDFLDACTEELARFKFADRHTEADKTNDVKSLNRKLDRHLVLLVKQQLGRDSLYLLPQGHRQDGETLRQCAERVLNEFCGANLKATFYGNAPCGFYKYTYPKNVQDERNSNGAKVFIYFARYSAGKPDNAEYKWLDRKELEKELHPKYHQSLAAFLVDEQ